MPLAKEIIVEQSHQEEEKEGEPLTEPFTIRNSDVYEINYILLTDNDHNNNNNDDDDNDTANDDATRSIGDDQQHQYSLDPRRFCVLSVFCLNNLLGSAIWITFAPIEDAVQKKFLINQMEVNWLSMISMAVYGPGTLICCWIIPKLGFGKTLILSSITMALGCLLRWWSCNLKLGIDLDEESSFSYIILLTGQGLVALGQTVFMNAPARIAASWFQNTAKVIGSIVFSGSVGIVLGQSLSPLFVVEETGENLDRLLAVQGLAMGICALLTYHNFKSDEPHLPPSASEAARRRQQRTQQEIADSSQSTFATISKDIITLLTDPQYIVLLIAFGIEYGVSNAILTLLQPWVASSGFPGDETAGLFGSLLISGGIVGTLIAATLLDSTRNFTQGVRWSFVVALGVGFSLIAALTPKCPIWLLASAFTITGMSQIPILTICLDSVAAQTYPIPEELSSAGLQLVGQYFGIILIDGMGNLIESSNSADQARYGFTANVNIAYLALLVISAAFACCYKNDDPRAHVGDMRTTNSSNDIDNTSGIIDDNEQLIVDSL